MPDNDLPANTPPETTEQGDTPSQKTDWRLVAIIAIALLLLVAVWVNRHFYGSPPPTEEPVGNAPGEMSRPLMSPVEQYAAVKRARELMATEEIYHAGSRTYIVARPPSRIRDKERPDRFTDVLPGQLFDITQRIEGVAPSMLHRRLLYGQEQAPMFADTFPALGAVEELKMVFGPAEAEDPALQTADSTIVIGVAVGGEAKAYPVGFTRIHDVINDTVGGKPILLCWNALAVNASAMERPVANGTPDVFKSAGLLYQGGIVAYDTRTRSLWSSLLRQCIAGERAGQTLPPIPAVLATWQQWKAIHPDTLILTKTEPALELPYASYPAFPTRDYLSSSTILFPTYGFDIAESPMNIKTAIYGVTGPDGKSVKAYSVPLLRETTGTFEDDIGGDPVSIAYDINNHVLHATDSDGNALLVETMFWMNWFGTHPETEIWQKDKMSYPFAEKTEPVATPIGGVLPPAEAPGTFHEPDDSAQTISAGAKKDGTPDSD